MTQRHQQNSIDEQICDACGKNFCPAPYHVYKVKQPDRTYWFCSWSCLCRYREGKTRINKKNKKVVKINAAGEVVTRYESIGRAALENGITAKSLIYRIKNHRPDKEGNVYEIEEKENGLQQIHT